MKNWKTSLIGILLIIISLFTVFKGVSGWAETMIGIAAGIGFIFS